MFKNLDVLQTAMAMARHAGHAQALSAQNIANADTPGYRARYLPKFNETLRNAQMGQRATRAKHLNGTPGRTVAGTEARDPQDPNENTVSLELEMLRAVGAKRQHDRAMAIYRSNLNILRSSLGRT